MNKIISYAAIGLIGLVASPFALGALLLLLGALVGVIGFVAVVIAWIIPLAITAGIAALAFYAIAGLLDSF